MNQDDSLSVGSVDDGDSTEEMYSLYTGLGFRRQFLTFRLGKPCFTVCGSRLKNVLLTNIAVSMLLIATVISVSVGLGLYAVLHVKPQPVIDYSLKAFTIPNHEVTRHQEAFEVAVEQFKKWQFGHRSRRSVFTVERHKRYAQTQYYRRHKVVLVYVAVGGGGDNIFTRERIETIHDIETDVVQMPEFSQFCFKGYLQHMDTVRRCDALNSIVSKYFYKPSSDAGGDQLVHNFDATVRAVLSSPFGFLYTDGHANQTFFESTFLRSELSFGMPLPGVMYYSHFFKLCYNILLSTDSSDL